MEEKRVTITILLKEGGYETLEISPKMLGDLALSLQTKDVETIHTQTRVFEIVGFMKTTKGVGERVIICGSAED